MGPLGACIQYIKEPLGARRIGLASALKRMIPQHRQWIARSYAVALTFFEFRFIPGITGLDQPLNLAAAETVVCIYLALSVLVGNLVNRRYEGDQRVGGLHCMGGQAGRLTP